MSLDLFNIENELAPKAGLVLISEPLSDDDYFGRSVVLLTEHGDKGSVGFVLNKESEYVLSDLVPELDCEYQVYKGGPVELKSLHYIHNIEKINNSIKIKDGLFWGGDFEQVKDLLKLNLIKENEVQFFLGYSGWRTKQLDDELNNNYWIVTELNSEDVFLNQTDNFWTTKLKKMGEKYRIWLNVPENPNLN